MKILLQLSVIGVTLTLLVFGLTTAWSDEEHQYDRRSVGVAKLQSPLYTEECGSCHMAYPPGLLPSTSWATIMTGLSDHFGDNAELDQETSNKISKFLLQNSAEHSAYRRSRSMLRGLGKLSQAPLRISKLPYFVKEHDELNTSMVQANNKGGSFSNCNACHRRAEQGLFSENEINIPGFGKWDD